mmetsp:Transcript_37319/g.98737  ORF Transcript_37319/g.98737 Transcript_37319/m.98737 type:complete len:81 (+) Transcript_37319:238-480(+)
MSRSDPSKGKDDLDVKVRRCLAYLIFAAHERWHKGEAENVFLWALSIFLIAEHAPAVAIEGLRGVVDCCVVSYRSSWDFL